MGGARIAARAARLGVIGAIQPGSRGKRLAARIAGGSTSRFDHLSAVAAWRLVDPARRNDLAVAAGLLFHRPQIDRSVDGVALRALALRVGEPLFDAACEVSVDGAAMSAADQLPRAADLDAIGRDLIRRADGEAPVSRLLDRAAALIGTPA